MKCVVQSIIFSVSLVLGVSPASAIPDTESLHSWGVPLTVTGPADSPTLSFPKILGMSGQGVHYICRNSSISYNLAKIEYEPVAIWVAPGPLTVVLYQSGINGLYLAPMMRGDLFNAGFGGFGQALAAPNRSMVVWTGLRENSYRLSYPFTVFSGLYVYRGMERIENALIIPRQPLYRYTCFDDKNVARETNTILSDNITLRINVSGCTPDSKATTVNMAGIPVANIENATSTTLISTKQQTFSLKCDPNIRLYYSLVDLNDPTNNTTTSTLTADSTAAGVGYSITSPDGTRLKFGPDGSAVGIPGQTKYFLNTAGDAAANNPMSHQLGFSYVRKPGEAIKTGSAKSLIGITYSYQ